MGSIQTQKLTKVSVANVLRAFAIVIASSSFAQAQAASKYGIINMQAVIVNVEEGKQARARLEKEIEKKEKELSEQKKELDKMNDEWKGQAALMSESARMSKQQEFQEKFMALRNAELSFQQEIKREEQKATQNIAVRVQKIVESMAQAKKLDMVFESNTSGLMYLKDPVDLTEDVVKEFEKSGKAKTAAKDKK